MSLDFIVEKQRRTTVKLKETQAIWHTNLTKTLTHSLRPVLRSLHVLGMYYTVYLLTTGMYWLTRAVISASKLCSGARLTTSLRTAGLKVVL